MSTNVEQVVVSRWLSLAGVMAAAGLILMAVSVGLFGAPFFRADAAGTLTVEIIAGYNLVVDSNVESPSTYAPSAATVGGKVCNTSSEVVTGAQVFIGDYTRLTPGLYPRRFTTDTGFLAQYPHLSTAVASYYAYDHIGGRLGTADAARYVGTLNPGECRVEYWHFAYPRRGNNPTTGERDNSGKAVWGETRLVNDDLSLRFDVWTTASGGVLTATRQQTMTMRNEISAMANKIRPNPDGHWFNTDGNSIMPGGVITSNGILYELGVINQGFDNDGNYTPDFNAWVQPIGDPSFDPSCFRLIRVTGVLTVSRGAGNPDTIIPFTDQMYFMNMPPDNNGVRGLVFYTFIAGSGPCSTSLSPYQEVASGSYNEKFNGDFGAGIPPVASSTPTVAVDKSGNVTTTTGGRITYTIAFGNYGTSSVGLPLINGALSFSDTIPISGTYVAGSLTGTLSNGTALSFLYSTDRGVTWSPLEPAAASVTTIRAYLNDSLAAGASGHITYSVQMSALYPPAGTAPLVTNCVSAGFGQGVPFATDCASTLIQGSYTIGDWVWRDENGNAIQDDGATGIAGVPVSLYYDVNGNSAQDSSDMFVMTTTTSITGWYTFNNLQGGNYVVVVNKLSDAIPTGYTNSTRDFQAVTGLGTSTASPYLNADFGFVPALRIDKALINTGAIYEGDTLTYTLRVTNTLPGNGTLSSYCQYQTTAWASGGTGTSAWTNYALAFNGASEPDHQYAVNAFGNNNVDTLSANAFAPTLPADAQPTKVEWLYSLYVSAALDPNVTFNTLVYTNSSGTLFRTYSAAATNVPTLPNQYIGSANQNYVAIDMTSLRSSWATTDPGLYRVDLTVNRGGTPTGGIYLDAAGWRLTYQVPCSSVDRPLASVPLTDTYNAAQLRFLSATPINNTTYTQTTPYANTGVVSWTNVGPIYPGGSKVITVTFKALEPGAITQTVINTATVRNATYGNGRRANDGTDDATSPVTRTTSIGDFVWRDLNSNGLQDTGEPGIPGVVITLTASVPFSYNGVTINTGSFVTTTTDATGYYLFDGLRNVGTFTTRVNTSTLPTSGLVFIQTGDPNYPTAACAGAQCDNTYAVAVTSQFTNVTWADFGYQLPALIDGTIWNDLNRSGTSTRDTGEPYLSGVVVTLTINSSFVATATTDANGYYRFAGNYSGNWDVTVGTNTLPANGTWTQSYDGDFPATPNQYSGTIVAGGYGRSDYSYYQTGAYSIGDTVYKDWNSNGVPDTTEGGIAGVAVSLYRDVNNNGVYDAGVDGFITSTTTSSTGYYLFSNLPGSTNYVVVVSRNTSTLPASFTQTGDPDLQGARCTTCDDQGRAGLSASSIITEDFGYNPIGFGSIGDTVWKDTNSSGYQDPGEVGLAGISVTLYADTNANGVYDAGVDAFIATTNTITSGYYLFSNLPADNYVVVVNTADADLPTDTVSGKKYTPSTGSVKAVTLSAGQTYLDADFGFMPPSAIGDTVYWDANSNGQQDWTESGISGVVVSLTNSSTAAIGGVTYAPGQYVLTTTTTITGFYLFSGLEPTTYTVQAMVGTGALPVNAVQTGDPDLTMSCQTAGSLAYYCDNATTQQLRGGLSFLNADFGYRTAGVIGDFVFRDLDGDGLQDAGEPGIGGVVVTATLGATSITTTTDLDGYYYFSNLGDGTWTVLFATPANLAATTSSSAAVVAGNGSVGTAATVVIASGAVSSINSTACTSCSLYIDAGFRLTGAYSVSGHVFYDSANDGGTYTPPSDLPYAFITVYLYDGTGQLIGTTTTDANGAYTFVDLPNGSYTVSYNTTAPQFTTLTLSADPDVATRTPGTTCATCNNYNSFTINNASVSDRDFGLYGALDFGDLPDSYGTLLGSDGARHTISPVYLGTAPDGDGEGRASSNALGDDSTGIGDENGVNRVAGEHWMPDATIHLNVTVAATTTAYLVGWLDWNNDGDFADAGEQVVVGSLAAGSTSVPVVISADYVTGTALSARFRVYDGTPTVISSKGLVTGGEVEDYRWSFNPNAVTLRDLSGRAQPGESPVWLWPMVVLGLGLLVFWRAKQSRRSIGG